jgi:uncharacterized protein YjiS (DUF1127 family)
MQITLRLAHPARARAWRFAPSILATLNQWRARSHWRRQLARLDSRDLADIGITRAEQFVECNKPFWRA